MKLAAGCVALIALTAGQVEAASINLTAGQVQEAIALGTATYQHLKSRAQPVDDLDPGYVVDLGPDIGRALLFTEFSAVELETRRWLAINRGFKPEDVEPVLQPLRGKLKFSVTLVGGQRDFLRAYTARLEQGHTRREPASWDIFRGSAMEGSRRRWVASGQYFLRRGTWTSARP